MTWAIYDLQQLFAVLVESTLFMNKSQEHCTHDRKAEAHLLDEG
jgi:hypothetical protein